MFVLQNLFKLTINQLIMKSGLSLFILLLFSTLTFTHCTSPSSNDTNKGQIEQPVDSAESESSIHTSFPLPTVPVVITDPDEAMLYLSKHFWDQFPFADTTLIGKPDITEQGFVDYIQILNEIPHVDAEKSLVFMLDKAKETPAMYVHFASLYTKYLYEPNSPFRNEELYIPVVNNLLKSGLLSETDQSVYGFHQEMIMKNRVRTTATDFVYTLANGDKKKMHALQSSYLILFFTNPDCPACAALTQELSNSKALWSMFSMNNPPINSMLTVLSIYPDSNIDQWRKALPNLPQKHWVNAYDDGTVITNKRLYDIKAIPTLYLLNKNKEIILKDTSLEEIEKYFRKLGMK